MKILKSAIAGTLESSDCLVMVEPAETLSVEIESIVMKRYGDQIKACVDATIREFGLAAGRFVIKDRGALDCVLRARVITAMKRGNETK